ncbi:FhuF 2Fe-2S C-terminal domain-containing protein [Frankia sp. EI5c]|uniref:(2Fe-2S)-binding protein n=1 Tax=Frankia sp. EI5c TaxID=683316 RepID=UPI0007C37082|nr:(2Fe-2S)-binding protein [Frankia sp. EI5c]OAA19859.1 FhuF 2Fe-2S C-terminal domain-containing protein [Frankia sp. EI5c]
MATVGREDARAALAGLAAINPYFEVDVTPFSGHAAELARGARGPEEPTRPAASFEPGAPVTVDELHRDGPALAAAIDGVRERLGGVERRVAASTLTLGHAARLWSVALGTWATAGIVPDLDPATLRVQPRLTAPIRLIVDRPVGTRPDPTSRRAAADLVRESVVERNLRPYFAAVRGHTGLAQGLLWGNAASALVGAASMLTQFLASGPAPGPAPAPGLGMEPEPEPEPEPELGSVPDASAVGAVGAVGAAEVRWLTALLLATPPLVGTTVHTLTADGRVVLSTVVRRSCCLFYRVPGGGTCGDCPL